MSRTPTRSTGTDIALIAGFAALIAVCAILPAINVSGPVPITLQTFGVLLTGAVLGARRGFLAVVLYLVVGAAGLPVFSGGTGGTAVFTGPTVGYLIGFPLAAACCGFLVSRLPYDHPDQRAGHLRGRSASAARSSSTPSAWPAWSGASTA